MSLDIRSTLSSPASRGLPFSQIASAVLPDSYELSLVICGDRLAQKMNKQYRKKSYRPNVLSFEIAKNEGEIFLNVRCAEREAKRFGVSVKSRVALLFVHGLHHLKGLDHSDKMEREEQKILKKFHLD
jgi:rRNA maturation RNase YbeY